MRFGGGTSAMAVGTFVELLPISLACGEYLKLSKKV